MINNLIGIIQKETEALKGLLVILEKQYKSIINKETFELDAIVDEIKLANREVAKQEVERRKLLNGKKVQDIINESGNKELDRVYREIKMVLESIKQRNKLETEREIAPLRQAEDAIYIDSSNLTIEQVVEKISLIINNARKD